MTFDQKAYMKAYEASHKAERAAHDKQRYQKYGTTNVQERRERMRLWRKEHPEKIRAQYAMNYAIATGRLTKPDVCSNCNQGGKIEGHHEDYDKPLEVVWLCRSCHTKLHHIERN